MPDPVLFEKCEDLTAQVDKCYNNLLADLTGARKGVKTSIVRCRACLLGLKKLSHELRKSLQMYKKSLPVKTRVKKIN